MTLAARGLTHRFDGGGDVLSGVDLRLEPGESVALLGPNGAGKTTLLRLLSGLIAPRAGAVEVEGRPIGEMTRREVARHMSIVPQTRPPAFGFSALEFVLMGFHASTPRFSLDGPAQRAAAQRALAQMEVAQLAMRPMAQLSGGEAQRVTMARTLASGATFWLLDEPTSNLDLRHQIALLDTVRSHCNGGGGALAIVHDPNLVRRWFDRVVMLVGGQVVADGPPEVTLTPDLFETAFGMRMRWVGSAVEGAWIPDLDPDGAVVVEEGATRELS